MKIAIRTVFSLLVVGALAFAGCNKYDDSALTGRVDDLENRVTELEKLVNDLNTNVKSLSTLVTAMEQENRITEIKSLEDGSGYEITFTKLGKMIIKNGEKPSIGVALDETDGIYYWTVDGKPMLDGENKIPATIAPEFKAEEGKLYFRVNGGDWALVEGAEKGIGLISGISQTEESVTFTLADGQEIVIPKVQSFALNFEFSENGVKPGAETKIPYTITAADEATVVKAMADGGYTVKTNSFGPEQGELVVTSPNPLPAEGSAMVFAINGKGVVSAKLLTFAEGKIEISDPKSIGKKGGEVVINISTNIGYQVQVDPLFQSWIHYQPATKALRQDEVKLIIDPNDTGAERRGTVNIMVEGESESRKVTIVQTAGSEADFNTFKTEKISTTTVVDHDETDEGWVLTKGFIIDGSKWDYLKGKTPMLSGSTNAIGKLESPMLEKGCGKLKIAYATNTFPSSLTKGFGFKVEIMAEDGTSIYSEDVKQLAPERQKEYIWTHEVNSKGKFKIVLTNLCLNDSTGRTADTVIIASVEWSNYSGE